MSQLHQVLEATDTESVVARDLFGRAHRVLLLAYEGPTLGPGDWLVAQSGFALEAADEATAQAAMEEIRAGQGERR